MIQRSDTLIGFIYLFNDRPTRQHKKVGKGYRGEGDHNRNSDTIIGIGERTIGDRNKEANKGENIQR